MNWLHASFGLGATIGPILMTALVSNGLLWRWGYVLVGIGQALLAIGIIVRATDWRAVAQANVADRAGHPTLPHRSLAATLARPLVWVNIGIYFCVAGVEATAGNWSFTLFTESRGVSVAVAGFWTSFYWASFTLGRFLFGFIADRVNVANALRLLMLLAVAAGALLWWNPANWVGFLGLAILGFALAPIFPLLVSSTPQRVGVADATNAVGFQVAAASLGIAILPGVAGILAQRLSPEIFPPFMILATLALIVLNEIAVRRAGPDPHAPGSTRSVESGQTAI
jgi:fucose permease